MKREAEIRHKAQQVAYRHLKKRLEANFRPAPDTCVNQRHLAGATGVVIGICGLDRGLDGAVLCDGRVPACCAMARRCPLWVPKQSKADVKADFQAILAQGRVAVALEFPDLAALTWVLDDADIADPDVNLDQDVTMSETLSVAPAAPSPVTGAPMPVKLDSPVKASFWSRLWHWWLWRFRG